MSYLCSTPVISLVAQSVKSLPAMRETWVWSLGQEDPLEKEMAIHSSILAWRIPWTEEPGGPQSMGSPRVGHNWVTNFHFHPCRLEIKTKWPPFLKIYLFLIDVYLMTTFLKYTFCTCLVGQWLRTYLPCRGTPVRSLIPEDPTCLRATKPGGHNYWALEPRAHALQEKSS